MMCVVTVEHKVTQLSIFLIGNSSLCLMRVFKLMPSAFSFTPSLTNAVHLVECANSVSALL